MGRIAQTTKVISEGGYEKVFHQTFEKLPGEKLKKSYACYLSTSSGPIMGVLYLSTANLAFCSDNPLSYKVGDQTQWSYYKIPPELGKLKNLVELRLDRNRLEGQIPGVTMSNFSATLHTMSIKPIQKDEEVCITYIDLLEPKVLSAVIGDVRGQGLMLGVELVTDRKEKMPTKAKTVVLFEKLKDLGVLLGKGGLQDNVFVIKFGFIKGVNAVVSEVTNNQNSWDQLKLSGFKPSMSVATFDFQVLASDEKSILTKVNSFCSLLQEGVSMVQSQQMKGASTSAAANDSSENTQVKEDTTGRRMQ
ncbi:hypothetical protein ZIOFF_032013 [Zingiber officinale]|uniref:GRAM domain-containing protein n=1 Tax=Zingiber officinale TaxID=94328 RepID=A0A8J5GIF6_ZINOF|nr:hypothetical protein ZIOFF_032013 [Zingiber officinale]